MGWSWRSAGRFAGVCGGLVFAGLAAAAQPPPATLTAVDVASSTPGTCRFLLEIRGRIGRVEATNIADGRFVFDLAQVAWDGPSRRVQPGTPGILEYRWAQYSRTPLVTRFVVEAADGWSCRHEPAPAGLQVTCSLPPEIATSGEGASGRDIAVVRGIGLASPIAGLDAEGLIDLSLGFVPQDMVRDGLPNFGAVRDDWLGEPRPHKGLDIYGDNVVVTAAAAGRVVGAGDGEKAGGWIKIRHEKGVETVYVHVSRASVKIGDEVAKGQPIAVVDGAAGNAVQAQLHFEVKLDGRSVDPVPFILAIASEDLEARIAAAYERLAVLEEERAARVRRGGY